LVAQKVGPAGGIAVDAEELKTSGVFHFEIYRKNKSVSGRLIGRILLYQVEDPALTGQKNK
jgi:hypothetical protein